MKKYFKLITANLLVIGMLLAAGCSRTAFMSPYELSSSVTAADATASSISIEIDDLDLGSVTGFLSLSFEEYKGTGEFNDLTGGGGDLSDEVVSKALKMVQELFVLRKGVIKAFLSEGKCIAVAYTKDTSDADKLEFGKIFTDLASEEDAKTVTEITTKTCVWDGNTAGVGGSGMGESEGLIIGTCPKLTLS
ncbi:MAG: hypothetical protein NC084_08865 [Bacteroides sp.]|nr:hypothetical protein [Eubacterium sp.]MCM1418739.1 hypothetical protein [Roseburia sp.]MCM1462807.1 hypothetical protein [Bacteroides sp.]